MQGTHAGHTATLLRASGEVLVTEGYAYMGTALYDPYTNAWRSEAFGLSRTSYTATEFPSGLVLFAGGSCPAAVAHRPTPPPLPLSRT